VDRPLQFARAELRAGAEPQQHARASAPTSRLNEREPRPRMTWFCKSRDLLIENHGKGLAESG